METDRLIEQLSGDLVPVRRLPRPLARLAIWLLVSVPAVLLVAWWSGFRPDLATRLLDPAFLTEELAALLTAVIGAYAAFCAGLPDQPDWKIWLPFAPMALWLAVLGKQCLDVVIQVGPEGLTVTKDLMCLHAIALGGLVPALAIVVLLRRSSSFRTTHACLCAALGAAALGAVSLRLYHMADAAIMVLVWQVGSVILLTLVAGTVGRLLLDLRRRHFSRLLG